MANRTDPLTAQIHSTDPQNLIEAILRHRIYDCMYWKEKCFGLTAETLLDRAVEINYIGSTYSHNSKATPFICLVLKLLQIQPDKAIIMEYINQEDYKYLRALGLFYVRLTSRPVEVYTLLEPFLTDYRKLASRSVNGWSITQMDQFVDELLTEERVCNITLPYIPKRLILQKNKLLEPRKSPLDHLIQNNLAMMITTTDNSRTIAPVVVPIEKKTQKDSVMMKNDNEEGEEEAVGWSHLQPPPAAVVPTNSSSGSIFLSTSLPPSSSSSASIREERDTEYRSGNRRRSFHSRERDYNNNDKESLHRSSNVGTRETDYDNHHHHHHRHKHHHHRRSRSRSPRNRSYRSRSRSRSPRNRSYRSRSRSRSNDRSSRHHHQHHQRKDREEDKFYSEQKQQRSQNSPYEDTQVPTHSAPVTKSIQRIPGIKYPPGSGTTNNSAVTNNPVKFPPPAEGSVEYWNNIRAGLNMKPLRE